jgi:isopentenyl-diphosphate Delta-isomerase
MIDDEQILLVNDKDEPIGINSRELAIAESKWRRTAGGMIIDPSNGVVLCHQRAITKDERGGLWVATFGGKSRVGETPIETARRELFEEFGLSDAAEGLTFCRKYRSEERFQWEHLFTLFVGSDAKLVADPSEVEACAWLDFAIVTHRIGSDAGWYSYGYEVEILAGMQNR